MADEQLKKDLKNILKIKGNITRSRPVKGQIKKEHWLTISQHMKEIKKLQVKQ